MDLTHHPDGQPLPKYGLDTVAKRFPFSYAQNEIPDLARLTERQMPDPDRKVDMWARRIVAGAGSTNTLDVLEVMTRAIQQDFRYGARHEEGTQTAAQTIELGTGTCRDFAVLMMEALRSFGLATRFVTGYLYDDTSGTTRGGGSTHAWCGVYLPGAGWVEYDPTNGLIAGANLDSRGRHPRSLAGCSDLGRLLRQCGRSDRHACRRVGRPRLAVKTAAGAATGFEHVRLDVGDAY